MFETNYVFKEFIALMALNMSALALSIDAIFIAIGWIGFTAFIWYWLR